jgi:hypothetical protein
VAPFPEIGEIETSGASADHGDTHDLPPPMGLVPMNEQRLPY